MKCHGERTQYWFPLWGSRAIVEHDLVLATKIIVYFCCLIFLIWTWSITAWAFRLSFHLHYLAWREHTDQGSSQHTCTHPGLKHSIKKGNWVRDICTEQEDLPLIPWLRWYQQQEWTIFLIAHDCIVNTAFGETLTVLEWMCVTIFRHSKNNYGDPCLCCFDAAEHPKPVHCANPFDTRCG